MTDVDKEWVSWVDVLGNVIYPGDYIAVSTINGRSPQMVIAQVVRINRLNSRGEEITDRKFFEYDEPIEKPRAGGGTYSARGEYRDVPSCTITAKPLIDARGFTRWSSRNGEPAKAVTYQIPGNCVKIAFKDPDVSNS